MPPPPTSTPAKLPFPQLQLDASPDCSSHRTPHPEYPLISFLCPASFFSFKLHSTCFMCGHALARAQVCQSEDSEGVGSLLPSCGSCGELRLSGLFANPLYMLNCLTNPCWLSKMWVPGINTESGVLFLRSLCSLTADTPEDWFLPDHHCRSVGSPEALMCRHGGWNQLWSI